MVEGRKRRARVAGLIGLACTLAYIAIWNDDSISTPSSLADDRRKLAYLDEKPARKLIYNRDRIDQNFQSFVQPTDIDSDIFRRVPTVADEEDLCDNILLFMPYSFSHNGHGSQLNNYILAATIATFTGRAMVTLEIDNADNMFKSNSQFGCPKEAWQKKKKRRDGPMLRTDWNWDFPTGLSRLLKDPAWLSRQCPRPCVESHNYTQWEAIRVAGSNQTEPSYELCQNDNGRMANVIPMAGEVRLNFLGCLFILLVLSYLAPFIFPHGKLGRPPLLPAILQAAYDRHHPATLHGRVLLGTPCRRAPS